MAMADYNEVEGGESKENLARLKDNIATSYLYFQENYERFRTFRTYVFKDSINDQQRSMLRKLARPIIEFNILESYISRLLGEFSKHEPSINVSPSEGVPVDQKIIDVVEQHFRHILYEANKSSFSYEVYKDLLSGGFSVGKVYTDYSSSMSFKQDIYVRRAFDPTLCGFDPMARDSHKGDGQFCFEIYPMTLKDFEREFPKANSKDFNYTMVKENKDIEGFQWSYKDIKDNKIILVADYYEKKKQRTRIVELADGTVMTQAKYKKLEQLWKEEGIIEQIPIVKGKPRWTILETICCTRLVENQILEYYETDYAFLPLVFIDGNSIILTHGKVNSTYQMTRPYVYHAKGVQDLKNFAGIALANHLQQMVQSKFIIKKEAIPQQEDSLEALKNIQRANTIIVNAYSENNPDKPIPEPIREVIMQPAPPEVMGAFQVTDPTTQAILGSFASNLGKNDNDLSGKAVIESSSVGNAAAMPYVVGYLAGLTQIANVCVDLMPKYLMGKRTVSLRGKDGKQDYQEINTKGNPKLDYNEHALKVNVEAGVNFQVQKNQAVQQIIALSKAMPTFAEFINSPQGMPVLIRNLDIYGADSLMDSIEPWMQKKQQQQQQMMQMQQQMAQQDPRMLKAKTDMAKVQMQGQEMQMKQEQQQFDNQIEIAKMAIEKELADAKVLESEAKISQAQIDSAVRLEESQTSLEVHSLEAASKIADIQSRQHNDHLATHKLAHEIHQATKGDNDAKVQD